MEITVKNYRGCAEAALTLAPLALVCAPNGGGKSSIAQAVAAALTRNPAIVEGVTKAGAEVLLREGEKRGRCTVGDESGSVSANWPGASVSEDGTSPQASEIACGLVSITGMKPKDAAAALIAAMSALPTIDDLRTACPGVRPQMLDAVWKRVQAEGWDPAARRASERSAQLKGAWEQITGEKWGSQKGANWLAPGYKPVFDTEGYRIAIDWDGLLAHHQQNVEDALAHQAANETEVNALRELAGTLEHHEKEVAEHQDEEKRLRASLDEMTAKLNAMPRPETPEQMVECPHCGGHLVVVSRTEVRAPAEGVSADENMRRKVDIDSMREAIAGIQSKMSNVTDNKVRHMMALGRAREAADKLIKMPDGTVTAEQVQAARDALAAVQAEHRAAQATATAAARHAEIVENNEIVAALAPNGVRQTVLTSKMAALRARLAELSQVAGWPVVELDDELRATLGGRAFGLLSASEQFRVRTILQVAIADLDGSECVIVDAADILDRGGRNGLFALLKHSGMRALVCMTMNRVEDVPDLAKAGIGRSYWIGGAVLAPVGA